MRLKADRKFRSIPFCRWLIVFHQTFFLSRNEANFAPFGISKGISRSSASIREHSFCFAFEINENGFPKLKQQQQ